MRDFLAQKRTSVPKRQKSRANRKFYFQFAKIQHLHENCNMIHTKMTKSRVALMAQALTTYKITHDTTQTPLRDFVDEVTNGGAMVGSAETRNNYLLVARMLGWNVRKSHGYAYENGVQIWSTVGH